MATVPEALAASLASLLSVERAGLAARLREVADALDWSAAGAACLPPRVDKPAAHRPCGRGSRQAFDLARYPQRLIALQVFYCGWNYHGFATQGDGPDACETVETHLFAALRATRLVDSKASWASCEYSRCGRTDRGVSALRQLVVLRARCSEGAEELDYVGCLNRQLPEDIRVLSWRPAPEGFSARFNARWRQYKYFFWQDGTLDTRAMAVAAARLCGEHDFRNICKMDVDVVSNFVRRIISFTVQDESTSEEHAQPGARRMGRMGTLWSLNVRGSAFLWHQVRCMATLLFMVGRGLESPDVIDALLDVQSMPGKPSYDMAAEEPLVLFDCGYEDEAGAFVGAPLPEAASTPERTHALLVEHLTGLARGAEVRARVCAYALQAALARGDPERKALQHVPLLRRRREASFEEQVARRPPGKVKARRPAEQRGESAADGE